MRSPRARFLLVSSADSVGLQAARSVAAEVLARDFELAHVVFNRAFVPQVDLTSDASIGYPPRLAALAPKLESMRTELLREQRRKWSNMEVFRQEHEVPVWALPEATRPLGDPSALAGWIALGRPVAAVT